jgi:uncharacterized protein
MSDKMSMSETNASWAIVGGLMFVGAMALIFFMARYRVMWRSGGPGNLRRGCAFYIYPRSRPLPIPRSAPPAGDVLSNMGIGSALPPRLIAHMTGYVRERMDAHKDPSHDWAHVERVWRLARFIAVEEKVPDTTVVEMAALCHDIHDWKLTAPGVAGAGAFADLVGFLQSCGVERAVIEETIGCVLSVGFKDSLPSESRSSDDAPAEMSLAARIVRDADRLDAIGAIGIARTFAFGGRRSLPLFRDDMPIEPVQTREEYVKRGHGNSVVEHFFSKLLRLRGLMLTETGRRLAERRHDRLVGFVHAFMDELALTAPATVQAFLAQPAVQRGLAL